MTDYMLSLILSANRYIKLHNYANNALKYIKNVQV